MEKQIVKMKKAYDAKHSVRYNSSIKDGVIQSMYIMKNHLPKESPEEITVTIE